MNMNRPRLIRSVRIAMSVVFGMLCVILLALWVRCYWRIDTLWGPITDHGQLAIVSMQGQVSVGVNFNGGSAPWSIVSGTLYAPWRNAWAILLPRRDALGFALVSDSNNLGVTLPYWFIVLTTAILARLPWVPWSKRFSLRTLLIAITLSAVVLGLVAKYGGLGW